MQYILYLLYEFIELILFNRAAALKTLFPTNAGGDKQSLMDIDTGKKLGGTQPRECPECSHLNARTAKKCQKCHNPLQGKACPQCGRPNHSWVASCYKCGASLPTYLGKAGKRHSSENLYGHISHFTCAVITHSCKTYPYIL